MIKSASKTIASLIRLKGVLGRSWGDLGPVLESILAIWYWKTYYVVRNDVFEKIPLQDPSWTDLGPMWAPKGSKMEAFWDLSWGKDVLRSSLGWS